MSNWILLYVSTKKLSCPALKYIPQLTSQQTHRTIHIHVPISRLSQPDVERGGPAVLFRNVNHCISQAVSFSLRFAHLASILGPLVLLVVPLWATGVVSRGALFRCARWALSRAGATFIKLGQWASTRPDVLPEDLCRCLAQLQAGAPQHGMAWNRRVVRDSFGVDLEEVFAEFSDKPIGSGTIAQVHRARLRSTGEAVAVKICHPHIGASIDRDLALLSGVARVFDWMVPGMRWLSLPGEVATFSRMMREQVDLRLEAQTLHRFSRNFAATARSWGLTQRALFPEPKYPLVARNCLVEDLICHAVPMAQFIEETRGGGGAPGRAREELAVLGFESFLQMLLWDNFVHADLHPGNILVAFARVEGGSGAGGAARRIWGSLVGRVGNLARSAGRFITWRLLNAGPLPAQPTPVQGLSARQPGESVAQYLARHLGQPGRTVPVLVFLDTGLVAELSRQDFRNFADLFLALVVKRDGGLAGRLMVERAPQWAQGLVQDAEGFYRGMGRVVQPVLGLARAPAGHASTLVRLLPTSLKSVSIAPVLQEVFVLVRRHHVRMDPAFTNLVMSMLCVEGLGRQLAPELDLRPLLLQAALQYLLVHRGGL